MCIAINHGFWPCTDSVELHHPNKAKRIRGWLLYGCCFLLYMKLSINVGFPKWMVYNGKSYLNGWFRATPILGNIHMWFYINLILSVSVLITKKTENMWVAIPILSGFGYMLWFNVTLSIAPAHPCLLFLNVYQIHGWQLWLGLKKNNRKTCAKIGIQYDLPIFS